MNNFSGVGRLTADAELQKKDGKSIVRFNIAIYRTKEVTDFFPCIVFGEYGEKLYDFLKKGKMIGIMGQVHNNQYEKDGEKRYYTSILVNRMELLEKKSELENIE